MRKGLFTEWGQLSDSISRNIAGIPYSSAQRVHLHRSRTQALGHRRLRPGGSRDLVCPGQNVIPIKKHLQRKTQGDVSDTGPTKITLQVTDKLGYGPHPNNLRRPEGTIIRFTRVITFTKGGQNTTVREHTSRRPLSLHNPQDPPSGSDDTSNTIPHRMQAGPDYGNPVAMFPTKY